jgi:hypothetical protein
MGLGIGISLGGSARGGSTPPAWAPTDASVPIVGWYKSDDGYAAGTWTDKSSAGNNLSNSATSVGANLNGRPTVSYNGVTSVSLTSAFALGGTGALSMFAVVKLTNSGSYTAIASYHTAAEFHELLGDQGTNNGAMYNGAVLAGSTSIAGAWKRVGVVEAVGGNQILYVNNASDASHAAAAAINTGLDLSLGARSDTSLPLSGLLAEICVFRGALTSGDRSSLDSYFQTAWAL